jgi:Protein of unknown function (DUF2785)
MGTMESAFWEQVAADGHKVPSDRPLSELTTELTAMLGDPDPYTRVDLAYATLATWIDEGVYDDLIQGLGDGMVAGLVFGLGTTSSDTVFRRSYSARVLTECIRRDSVAHLLPPDTVLRWGDRLMSWFVRERDLRGYVPGKGWAHTMAHGADALQAIAASPGMGRLELTVILDVLADRLTEPTEFRILHGEDDRLAAATLTVLRRDLLASDVLDPWVNRLADSASALPTIVGDPYVVTGNVQSYLRALHLALALAPNPPACRADLLLTVIGALRATNRGLQQ